MKKFFYKVFKFVAQALRSNTDESSKRLFGAIGFICSIIFIGLWERDLIKELLFVSAGLLGMETVFKLFSISKKKK